ncbi:hypothetical protein [Hydrogenophaga sp. T2]|uniref:hypothetical protein n=1 Tax=Hydrogenophaga sp. T2 TaxID=3132823 RepID=UPI003CECF968
MSTQQLIEQARRVIEFCEQDALDLLEADEIENLLRQLAAELERLERKPLTRAEVKNIIADAGYSEASPQERADFINGIRHAERAHHIGEGESHV